MPVVSRCTAFKNTDYNLVHDEKILLAEFIKQLPVTGAYTSLRYTPTAGWMSVGLHCERLIENARGIYQHHAGPSTDMLLNSSLALLQDRVAPILAESLTLIRSGSETGDTLGSDYKAIIFLLPTGPSDQIFELYSFVDQINDTFNPRIPIQALIFGAPRKNPSWKDSQWMSDRRYITDRKPIDVQEMILYENDRLYEGTVSNFWVILKRKGSDKESTHDVVLQTAPYDLVLTGIMSRTILQAASKLGMKVEFACPRIGDFSDWIGCFTTNALKGITPIKRIGMLQNQDCFREFSDFDKIFALQDQRYEPENSMTQEFMNGDSLRDRKRAILARINRKYNSNAGSLQSLNKYTKLHPIESESFGDSESFLRSSQISSRSHILPHTAGGDSKEEYIEKLKKRIKQLEQAPIERMGSSRFNFDSDAAAEDSPPPQRKPQGSGKSPHTKSLKPLSQPSNSDHHHSNSKSKPPHPKSPPISASGSYDLSNLSKYKALGPIPTTGNSSVVSKSSNRSMSISSKGSIIPETDPNMKLKECDICSRKFRVERLEKHKEACSKSRKKRAVFDEKKMRLRGTELETFKKPPGDDTDDEYSSKSKPKKGASKGSVSKAASKSKSSTKQSPSSIYAHPIDDELTPCSHCGRKFSESSLEKHEKICSNIKAKPKRDVFRVKPV